MIKIILSIPLALSLFLIMLALAKSSAKDKKELKYLFSESLIFLKDIIYKITKFDIFSKIAYANYEKNNAKRMYLEFSSRLIHSLLMTISLLALAKLVNENLFLLNILIILLLNKEAYYSYKSYKEKLDKLDYQSEMLASEIAILITAGYNTRDALKELSLEKENDSALSKFFEILKISDSIGEDFQTAVNEFTKIYDSNFFSKLALLITSTINHGTSKLSENLDLLVYEIRAERKYKIKIKGEKISSKLILPTALSLLVVIGVLIVPIVKQFVKIP